MEPSKVERALQLPDHPNILVKTEKWDIDEEGTQIVRVRTDDENEQLLEEWYLSKGILQKVTYFHSYTVDNFLNETITEASESNIYADHILRKWT